MYPTNLNLWQAKIKFEVGLLGGLYDLTVNVIIAFTKTIYNTNFRTNFTLAELQYVLFRFRLDFMLDFMFKYYILCINMLSIN